MENWKELFPVEGIAPMLGGIVLWFGVNFLFLGPEIIGPRLAEKYYLPTCRQAVAEGRQAAAQHIASLREQGEAAIRRTMEEVERAARQGAAQGLQTIFGGPRQGQEFLNYYGPQLGGMMAPYINQAMQQRFQQERAALDEAMQREMRQARSGIVHANPAQFCGCVVNEGLKDRLDLAAFTATLRLYTPGGIRRLEDGSFIHQAQACGRPPIV